MNAIELHKMFLKFNIECATFYISGPVEYHYNRINNFKFQLWISGNEQENYEIPIPEIDIKKYFNAQGYREFPDINESCIVKDKPV